MNNRVLLSIFILSHLFLVFFAKELLETNDVIFNSLSENLTFEQIEDVIAFKRHWGWIFYLFIPIVLVGKILLIAGILDVGCFLFDKRIRFKRILNIVVRTEFIFLLVIIFKTLWFYFYKTEYTLEDLQFFFPLSVLNLVGYEGIKPWFVYPLQVLNLFELAYWVILAYLLDKAINDHSFKGMSIVASSYGVSLLIWVVGVMFFTLNIS